MASKVTKKNKLSAIDKGPNAALNRQVMEEDTLTIADAREFIACGKKGSRQDFLNIADRSWNEIKKRNKRGKLYGGNDLDRVRRWARFPLWWSCLQIRTPLTLARLPIPVLKDTQGDDPMGRTVCIAGERLTRGILKTFDAFSEFSASVADFNVTDFGWGRVYYRKKEHQELEKVRLQEIQQEPMEPQEGQDPNAPVPQLPPLFLDPEGNPVENPEFDEFGPYVLTGGEITVEDEEVYFEAGLYSSFFIDDVNRYPKATRLAFEYQFSYREFTDRFGRKALDSLPVSDIRDHREGKMITVYEYHDKFLKETRFFAENGEGFIQPLGMTSDEMKAEGTMDHSDIYGLSDFFPCTPPLIINAPTDEFWPTPEYFQVADILDDIHNIVGRMVLLTKAIRVRFFFDSSIPLLKQLIGETGEGTGLGIPNLENSLMNAGGKLTNLVAYFPVDEMIQGLGNMYTAFEQRLNMFYNITGLSDLLRGQSTGEDKTYGERQLEGKFALNRIEPRQRKVQEWIKDQYQLLMEMALKNFSDESIDDYITPQTLDQEDKERYVAALELLKQNKRSRFRMDFETDSTIAVNEQWRKKQATELANTLTKAMESTAKVAETQPELAQAELKVLKHLIGEFSDGKLFIDEIQDAIQQVIDKVAQPKDEGPNIDLEKLKLEGQKLGADSQFKQLTLQSTISLEYAKLSQKDRQDSIKNQLEQLKVGIENGATQGDMQLAVTKLQADIAQGWEDLNIRKQTLLADVQKEIGKKEMEQMRTVLDARVKAQEITLAEADQALRAFEVQLTARDSESSLQERWATEKRLAEEHGTNIQAKQAETVARLIEATTPEPAKAAPVSIDLSKTVHVKSPDKGTKPKKEPKK